jgi:glutathione S-transferase
MYTLHIDPDTASTISRLALEELGVPHTIRHIDRIGGELNSAAYRALNPAGLIPVLETPDGPIFETGAILLWLADRHGALAPEPTAPDRAAFLSWFIFTANTLHPGVMGLIYPARAAGEQAASAALAQTYARLMDQFALVDRVAATRPGWLDPDKGSILSIYICVLLRWTAAYAADPAFAITTGSFPALHALACAQEIRPATLRVAAAESLGPAPFSGPKVQGHAGAGISAARSGTE